MERDAKLMHELQLLMREYVEHRGRTSVPTDGWESADRCEQDSWGSDGYQHDELDALGLVDDDFLNLPSDDEDEQVDVLDVWSADKPDALEEMRTLEMELAKETGQRPSYLNVRQNVRHSMTEQARVLGGAAHVRPSTAAARPYLHGAHPGERYTAERGIGERNRG
eukprot:CAMPEP_0179408150 /NCGR_PEP_ID=MMETSP0799-20121207/1928_1 /TAXON_ID=46947 /ORGANISM="Geminigera cryophila, Strain CCMP2564" /LENGTH=165 /DNA_ID=CAMNT_0021179569 /DNA_START=125 /DNA_END=619 /DNA_ORIENTATION=+